jgi:hypothetical protein
MQNFTFNAAGTLSSSATRNELLSFALSLHEVAAERDCVLSNTRYLDNNLGLSEWIDAAFSPITAGLLKEGFHKPPQGPKSVSVPGAPGKGGAFAAEKAEPLDQAVLKWAELNYPALTDRAGNLLTDDIRELSSTLKEIQRLAFARNISQDEIIYFVGQVQLALTYIDRIVETINDGTDKDKRSLDVGKYLDWLTKKVKPQLSKVPKLDAPIEAFSHQVSFVVTLNANIGPNWSLARFKGPTPSSGSLASATRTRTNTLTIVIGAPNSAGAANARSALAISNAIRNVLTPGL